MEIRTIQLMAYRTHDGLPTCDSDEGHCRLLVSRGFGIARGCQYTGQILQRDSDGPYAGRMVPDVGCPVWEQS